MSITGFGRKFKIVRPAFARPPVGCNTCVITMIKFFKYFGLVVLVLFGGLCLLAVLNPKTPETNAEHNASWIRSWANPGDTVLRIAFKVLESRFSDVNAIRLCEMNYHSEDTLYNGIPAPMKMTYFT